MRHWRWHLIGLFPIAWWVQVKPRKTRWIGCVWRVIAAVASHPISIGGKCRSHINGVRGHGRCYIHTDCDIVCSPVE